MKYVLKSVAAKCNANLQLCFTVRFKSGRAVLFVNVLPAIAILLKKSLGPSVNM